MITSPKTAAHRLLLSKRDDVARVIRELDASSEVPLDAVKTLAGAWIVLYDLLQLHIRWIDDCDAQKNRALQDFIARNGF